MKQTEKQNFICFGFTFDHKYIYVVTFSVCISMIPNSAAACIPPHTHTHTRKTNTLITKRGWVLPDQVHRTFPLQMGQNEGWPSRRRTWDSSDAQVHCHGSYLSSCQGKMWRWNRELEMLKFDIDSQFRPTLGCMIPYILLLMICHLSPWRHSRPWSLYILGPIARLSSVL